MQGGSIYHDSYGRGGYSYGNYVMNSNKALYISVGGKGQDGTYQSRSTGGWNGGGDGEWDHQDDECMGAGGGCTSIQTSKRNDGQLRYYESVRNSEVLIVAGGGGAGLPYMTHIAEIAKHVNQYGGGETGAKAWYDIGEDYENSVYTQQATQTSGYAFGLGQSAPSTITTNSEIPGGGGGWYGGYTVIPTVAYTFAAAGGGSGHIGTMLTNGATIAVNATMPSPPGGTETGHSGNGYCKITWHPAL